MLYSIIWWGNLCFLVTQAYTAYIMKVTPPPKVCGDLHYIGRIGFGLQENIIRAHIQLYLSNKLNIFFSNRSNSRENLHYITASLMIETFPQFESHSSATRVFRTNRRFTTAALIRTTCISGNIYNLTIPVNRYHTRTRKKNMNSKSNHIYRTYSS